MCSRRCSRSPNRIGLPLLHFLLVVGKLQSCCELSYSPPAFYPLAEGYSPALVGIARRSKQTNAF
jgi:hypothetical protein